MSASRALPEKLMAAPSWALTPASPWAGTGAVIAQDGTWRQLFGAPATGWVTRRSPTIRPISQGISTNWALGTRKASFCLARLRGCTASTPPPPCSKTALALTGAALSENLASTCNSPVLLSRVAASMVIRGAASATPKLSRVAASTKPSGVGQGGHGPATCLRILWIFMDAFLNAFRDACA